MTENRLTLEDLNTPVPTTDVLEAEWAWDQVMQLFADLGAGANVKHVQLKTADIDAAVPLTQAESAFASGEATAVQIRYVFEREMWCDTIMPGDPTTKIVRTRLPN